jgi:Family of unknown function (DUF6232)
VSQERVYLNEQGVEVTAARLVVPGGKSFALANVTKAVRSGRTGPKEIFVWGTFLTAFLLVAEIFNYGLWYWQLFIPALLLPVACAGAATVLKPTKAAILMTPEGEVAVFTSTDGALVGRIIEAVNEVIADRTETEEGGFW